MRLRKLVKVLIICLAAVMPGGTFMVWHAASTGTALAAACGYRQVFGNSPAKAAPEPRGPL